MLLTGRYLVISRQLLLLLSANAWKTRHKKKKLKKNEVNNKNKLFRRRWLFYKCTCVDYYWIATISPSYIKQRLIPHICISLTTATTIMLLFLHQNYNEHVQCKKEKKLPSEIINEKSRRIYFCCLYVYTVHSSLKIKMTFFYIMK